MIGELLEAAPLLIAATEGTEEELSPLVKVVPGLMIWTLLAFGAAMIILKKFAWPKISEILDERQHIDGLLLTIGYDAANSNRSDEGEHTARFKVLLDRADPRIEGEVIERLEWPLGHGRQQRTA